MNEQGMIELSRAAHQVRNRIARNAFVAWLAKGRWLVPLAALAAVILCRLVLGMRGGEWLVVIGILAIYLAAGVLRALAVRPSPLRALAVWDEAGGHKDGFSSAWSFLTDPETVSALPEGRQLHLRQVLAALPDSERLIPLDLPSPKPGWPWLAIAVALAFSLTPWLRPALDPGDLVLTEEMAAEAERQAAELEREKQGIEKIDGLTEEEKREIAKLGESVDGLAEDLAASEGKTARDVLEGLEGRARAAERLAEKMGAGSDEWASEEMIREMSQHADTGDLAAAIKDKNANLAARESDKISGTLDADELKIETQDRVTTALERTISKATKDDLGKPVGERVGNAARKMDEKQPKTAAREFAELAKHFRLIEEREAAEEKLRDLADKLREAGNSISGSKLEKVQKLASNGQSGQKGAGGENLQPLSQANGQNQPSMTPMTPTPGQGSSGQQQAIGTGQNLPIPGNQTPQGQGQQQGQGQGSVAMPVPGTGQQGKVQQGIAGASGQKPGQNPGTGLMAPIPGMNPGAAQAGAGLGASAGGSSAASSGGDQAGVGTMGIGNQQTEAMKAAQSAQVVAQTNADGESTLKAVQGQERTEQAQRQQQDIIRQAIGAEEDALDEQALPASRRDHVLRYFTALRERFEKSE